MPNRSSNRGQGPKDPNVAAWEIVQQATGQMPKPEPPAEPKNPGVTLGGKARAAKLSAERRAEIASKAAKKRWGKG